MVDTFDVAGELGETDQSTMQVEEDIFKPTIDLPDSYVDTVSSKVAAIQGIRADNLDAVTQAYITTNQMIRQGNLESVKQQYQAEEALYVREAVQDTAVRGLENGEDISDLASVLSSYVDNDIRTSKNQIIEDTFYNTMIERAATNPNYPLLYEAILDTKEEGHALERYYEQSRRYNKLRNFLAEKGKDKDDQGFLTSLSETIGNFATGKRQHMLLNIQNAQSGEEKGLIGGTIDLISSIISDDPSEFVNNIRNTFENSTAEEYDEWFEDFVNVIEASSGLVGTNEAAVEEITNLLVGAGDAELGEADIWNRIELLEVPLTSLGSMLLKMRRVSKAESLMEYGGSDLAEEMTERTLIDAGDAKQVLKEARKEDAVENIMPTGVSQKDKHFNAPKPTQPILERLATHDVVAEKLKEELTKGRRITEDRLEDIFKETQEEVREEFGNSFVTDFNLIRDTERGVDQIEFLIGTKQGRAFADEFSAKVGITKRFGKDAADYEAIPDPSTSGYFIKGKRDLDQTFVVDENLANGYGGLIGGILRSSTSILPEWMGGKAMASQFKRSNIINQLSPVIKDAINLPSKEKAEVIEMMKMDDLRNKQMDMKDFIVSFQKRYKGRNPTDRQVLSYESWKRLRTFSADMQDYSIFTEKHTKGYRKGKLVVDGEEVPFDELGPIRQVESIDNTRTATFFDTETGKVKHGDDIGYGADTMKKKLSVDKTHELFQLDRPYEGATHILAKKGNVVLENLPLRLMKRTDGWNREYDFNYFVHSPVVKTISGKKAVYNHKTVGGGKTLQEAQKIADDVNEAVRLAVRKADGDDKLVRHLGFERGIEEIDELIQAGKLDPSHPVQVAFKNESIRIKNFDPDVDLDLRSSDTSNMSDFLDNQGSLIYSRKGPRIQSVQGEIADIIDPDLTMAKVIQQTVGRASIADYRATALNQWTTSYGKFMKDRPGLSREQRLLGGLSADDFKEIPPALRNKALQSAQAIRNQLSQNSDYGQLYQTAVRKMMETAGVKFPKAAKFGMDALYSRDPLTFMRTVAFDSKLGLFNPDQIILQINQAAVIAAMDPTNAPRLYQEGFHIMLASFSPHKDVHSFISKKFFTNPKEAQEMINVANETGVLKVGGEVAMLDHAHLSFDTPRTATGAFNWVREKGRFIFNNAEKFNRSIAFSKSWNELRKTKSVEQLKGIEGKEQLMLLTDKYSNSMTQMSQARWQKGGAALPMQFISYPLRMIENILPEAVGGSTLWKDQKKFLMGAHLALYGSAAVPFAQEPMFEMLRGLGLDPEENKEVFRLALGGISDAFIAHGLGIDSTQSNRAAIGLFVTDFVNKLQGTDFNQTSFIETIVGAGPSITWDFAEDGASAVMLITKALVSDHATLGDITNIGLDAINQFARENVQTWNRTSQMIWALNTGAMVSSRSSGKVSDVDFMQSIGLLLGLRPSEMSNGLIMKNLQEGRRQFIKDQTVTLKRLHNERMLALQNDDIQKYEEINRSIVILQSGGDRRDNLAVLNQMYKTPTHRTLVQTWTDRFNRDIKIPEQLESLQQLQILED